MFWRKRVQPDPVAAQVAAAQACLLREELTEAVTLLEAVLVTRPEHREASLLLGEAWCEVGRAEEGLSLLTACAQANPEDPAPHLCLGRVYQRLGKRDWAIAELRQVLLREPDHAEGRRRLREATAEHFALSSDALSTSRREQHAWALAEFKQVQATARRLRPWWRFWG